MFGNNNSNVFGQLNQNLNNKPAFNFGSSTQPAQQQQSSPFVFGATTSQNEVKQESNKLNSFNFVKASPSSLSNNVQPNSFCFNGFSSLPVNLHAGESVNNLQQILTPQTRLMKKPSRRIKK